MTKALFDENRTPSLLGESTETPGTIQRIKASLYGMLVSLGTRLAGEDITNDIMKVENRSTYVNLTATALAIKTGTGRVKGIFVASHTSGTIKIWDSLTAANSVIIDTFTPTAGTYIPLPDVEFATGLSVTLGGTINCTIFYK